MRSPSHVGVLFYSKAFHSLTKCQVSLTQTFDIVRINIKNEL